MLSPIQTESTLGPIIEENHEAMAESKSTEAKEQEAKTTTKALVHYRNGITRAVLGARDGGTVTKRCWTFKIEEPCKVKYVSLEKDGKIITEVYLSCACAAMLPSQVIRWFA